ncbi:MAG: hypothetical protein ACTS78_01430 [Arsenophonus sp. NC-WZS1-MAG3]
MLQQHPHRCLIDWSQPVIYNSYFSQTPTRWNIDDIEIKILKVMDNSRNGISFNILLLGVLSEVCKNSEELLLWLYTYESSSLVILQNYCIISLKKAWGLPCR